MGVPAWIFQFLSIPSAQSKGDDRYVVLKGHRRLIQVPKCFFLLIRVPLSNHLNSIKLNGP